MELQNLFSQNNISSYEDVKSLLTSEPYKLIVKDDSDHPSLYMITYGKESRSFDNDVVRQCRGLILEKETNNILCYSFNRGTDIHAMSNDDSWQADFPWEDVQIEEAVDGTQIRLYYYDGEWRVATTRCIDAKKAYWYSSRSFYDLFMEAVRNSEGFSLDDLDQSCCYAFVLKHPENRIVVRYEKAELCHVMTRSLSKDDGYPELDIELDGVSRPTVYKRAGDVTDSHFSDYGALRRHAVEEVRLCAEGFVLKSASGFRGKLRYCSYDSLKEIRGNTWNMFYRYLELRKDEGALKRFYSFYPEYRETFSFYEHQIQKFVRYVHRQYVFHRVKKVEGYIIPDHLKVTLYKLHGTFLEERTPRTQEKVQAMLDALHPKQLCALLNRHYEVVATNN